MMKRIMSAFLAFILFLCMALSSAPTPVFAATSTQSTEKFAGGDGTEANPYLIATKEQLNNVRNHLSSHFKMIADIEFTDADFDVNGKFYNDGYGFIPIGSKDSAFCGSFDGNGLSISNLLIYNVTTTGDAYAGLFAINNGVVKNLGIKNGNVSVYPDSNRLAYCGSIAGKNLGTITDCYSTGNVWSRRYAGGIAGYNSGEILNCYNNGVITALMDFDLCAGGIVGYNYDGVISNCYNNGQISSSANVVSTFMTTYYAFAGGIVGYGYDGTVEKCYNTGNINATSNVTITENSDAYASANSGGIIGSNRSCSISECYNIGAISADTTADGHWYDTAKSYAGGIAGSNASGIGSCYNVGTLTTTSSTGHNYPGGIAGNNSGNISTSYNIASGIENIVSNNSGTIKNCYFHSETLSAGCKLASLFSVLTYQGFNFDSVWQMSDGDYPLPVLRSVKNYASFEYSPEENTVDFASGKGTDADPFVIKTITHLDNIRKYPSSYFVLANDITFDPENEAFATGWKSFAFKGYFDGQGYKITGIRITVSNTLEYQWRDPGLFSSNDGTIKNLTVEDMWISVSNMGDEYGGFICAVNNGVIINCHSKSCTISLQNIYHFFGGIAGDNSGSIQNCTSNNTINWGANGGRIGGITANNTGSISGCTNNSTITNIGSYTPISGGISAQNSGIIISSKNLATLFVRSTYSQRSGYAGGIVGKMTGGKISECYNLGAITTEATEYKGDTYSGGIVAYISGGDILDCYTTGDVYGESYSYSASCYVGGIVGYNNSIGSIKNCYSIGGNSGRASSRDLYVGYVCGYNASNTIENCYYLGIKDYGSGSGDFSTMYGETVAALKEKNTYANFDFDNTWTMSGNGDYPFPELISTPMVYEKEIKSISIESMPTKLQYIQNYELLDLEGGMLKITYEYEESEMISLSEATVSGFDNSVDGKQSILVSYFGQTTEFEIEIVKKSLVRIEVAASPNKTTYYEGDTLVLDGLRVIAHYNDETFEPITGYSITGFSPTLGTKTITVQYQGKSDTFDVIVKAVELVSIAVTTKPNKLTYLEGDPFSEAGMVITAYYNNNTSAVITEYTINGYSSTPGSKTITVIYSGKSATFTVEVTAKSLSHISITTKPNKLTYLEGDTFDGSGMMVTVYYNNGSNEIVADYTVSGYSSTPGSKTITVSYNNLTTTFTVTVVEKSLVSIAITANPVKTQYIQGESLDTTGMIVTAYYNNDSSEVVADYSITGFRTDTVGTQIVTVTYGGKTAEFTIAVKSTVPNTISSDVYTVKDGWIRKISAGTTVKDLINGINEGQYIKAFNGERQVSGDTLVATGMVIKLLDGATVKATVTVVVTGDTNGDGNISVTDMIAVKSHVLKKSTLSGAAAQAADTSGDNAISITDFIQIKAHILGKSTIE